ncbi:hypothetical protein J3459_005960 [Metarhizium acridum]|nr:hypothetical protein J3459_005960 [Metarhizium acridum]
MSATTTLATPLGNLVGVHVYPAKGPVTQVVIANHGNVRPPRYMNRELEALTNGRTRVVIAVDFIGYDLSSRIYPGAKEVIYFGRSVGNFGWGHCMQFPKVTKVVACVPFGDLHTVVGRFVSLKAPQNSLVQSIVTAVQYISLGQILGAAFPSGSRVDDLPGAQTRGFSLASIVDALVGPMPGKSVLLMKASEDELIPDGEADRLAAKLEEKGIKTKVMALTGSHHALPWDEENKGFAPAAMEDFFANGL